ncbi:MAG: hypothetical protein K0R09_1767 [Clostridiales bacterium]|jgi:hypothetical protein|nr:hypothetical protein [Clostridiales bacterium]
MKNIIRKAINRIFNFVFSWGFSFFSAGYFFYKKLKISVSDEFNKLGYVM